MKKGFFTKTQLSGSKSLSTVPRCGQCGLYRNCNTPKMPPTGDKQSGVLFLAEAPGTKEDSKGIQLVGEAGQYLRRVLRNLGYDLEDFLKTNAVICHPTGSKTPDSKTIQACRPNLIKTLRDNKPHTIIPMGEVALESFMPVVWKEKVKSVSQWVGWDIPSIEKNMWICPTYHPSYLVRTGNVLAENQFKQHLKQALDHTARPYTTPPDFKSKVTLLHRSSEIAAALRDCRKWPYMAFDYEGNCLKPETVGSKIVSCSVSNGKRTYSFPWTNTAIECMIPLYKNPTIKKIAANMKFEHRWTYNKLGFNIRGWYFDTMVGQHVLDNRKGITGLKFQAFVRLGMPDYNEHIEPYLKSKGKSSLNRIHLLDFNELLLYGGLDSYCTWYLAWRMIKELGLQKKRIA